MGLSEEDKRSIEEQEYRKFISENLRKAKESSKSSQPVEPNEWSCDLEPAKDNFKTQKTPTPTIPNTEENKIGCFGGCLTFIILAIILLVSMRFLNPGYISQAWQHWIVETWVGDTLNLVLDWFWQTPFWAWVKSNKGYLLIGAIVIGFLTLVSTATSDLAGSDNKGCLLLALCLLFPPLLIIVLVVWAISPSKED